MVLIITAEISMCGADCIESMESRRYGVLTFGLLRVQEFQPAFPAVPFLAFLDSFWLAVAGHLPESARRVLQEPTAVRQARVSYTLILLLYLVVLIARPMAIVVRDDIRNHSHKHSQ